MTIIREQVHTALPVDRAFAFIADFANAERWDPGVAASTRLTPGPVDVGARYLLQVRMRGGIAPMEYEIATYEPSRHVVLTGSGSGVAAIDDIRFEPTATGTRIDYVADIRLRGWMRLAAPVAGGAFARIAREARDGMERALDGLAGAAR